MESGPGGRQRGPLGVYGLANAYDEPVISI